ncbi:MAG TPA: hypothetical protein PKY05_16120, partial [Fibrobacteria bacterium]|nr:hypothetical protein [Fibrobacteria bacterium]
MNALAGSRHKQPDWTAVWRNAASKTGDAIQKDSLTNHDIGDSVRLSWNAQIPDLALNGSVRWVSLKARDRYGNQDSIWLGVGIDAMAPRILSIQGRSPAGQAIEPDLDTSSGDTVYTFHPTEVQLDPITKKFMVEIHATDSAGLDTLTAKVPGSEVWAEFRGKKDSVVRAKVLPLDIDSTDKPFQVVLRDLAGNERKLQFLVLSDRTAPWLTVHQVRKSDGNGWLVWPTLIDSFQRQMRGKQDSADSVIRKVTFLVENGKRLMSPTSLDTSNPYHAEPRAKLLAYSGMSKEKLVTIRVGDTIDLDIGVQDDGLVVAHRIQLDGRDLDSSAFPHLDSLLSRHSAENLVRFVATKRKQKMVVWAKDWVGNQDSLIVWFVDSLPDLQVVDPQNDHHVGQDVGEVYMRQTLVTRADGSQTPRTHWLVHSWNPLPAGQSWSPPLRLYVDSDGDSTTGDTAGAIRGADRALELISGDGSDTAKGAHAVPYSFQGGVWTAVGDTLHEGGLAADGMIHFGNHPDDPRTVQVGTGTQILPSRRQAPANLGVWEIGWDLFGTGDQLHQLRWGIVSTADGDTVIDTVTHRLRLFDPYGFRPVVVDGDVSEWRDMDVAQMRVWTGTKVSNGQLRVKIAVANDTGVPVKGGFELRYYFKGVAGTVASLDPTGQVQAFSGKITVGQPVRVPGGPKNPDSLLWSVSVKCANCSFNSQGTPWGIGTLVLTGPSSKSIITSLGDDWSYQVDTASTLNPHVPA